MGIGTVDPKRIRKGTRLDSMGVRTRDTTVAIGVDAAIAEVIQTVNEAGFETNQSMSGLKVDYPSGKRYSENGYLGFWKDELKPGQEEQIRRAARKAGLYTRDTDIYFSPAIVVRTGVLKSGKTQGDIRKEANALTGLKVGAPDFLERLPERDKIWDRLVEENGGPISQADIARRWERFTKALTGKTVRVG